MTSPGVTTSPVAAAPRERVRPEIQALRAVAVALVVVYHLWPDRLTGGYVGVDVFFAISGYLITSHLYRSVERDGTVGLRSFYARRIRRLLPASLLVLLVVGVVTLAFIPVRLWTVTGQNLIASAFYFENWSLVANSVDYLGASTNTIPTQHFWSLSVEEQFYLLWPILLLVAVRLLARGRLSRRTWATIVIGVVGAASFVYSVWSTDYDQASAYFNTFSRIWEFALGAIAALVLPRLAVPRRLAIAMTWVGIIIILVVSVTYRDSSPFPGWIAAVPVLATIAVIAGGEQVGRLSLAPVLRLRPIQFLGDISYSVYLWHWPIIVLLPIAIERPMTTPLRVVILVLSLVVAWLSKRFVEDPLRATRLRSGAPRPARFPTGRVFVAALAGMLVVSAVGGTALAAGTGRVDAAQRQLAALPAASALSCFGASALPKFSCDDSNGLGTAIYPDPIIAATQSGSEDCQQTDLDTALLSCTFGAHRTGLRVAIAGDSHATEWLSALRGVASKQGWKLTTYLRSGCGLSLQDVSGIGSAARCETWNESVVKALVAGKYDAVIVSTRSTLVGGGQMSTSQRAVVSGGMERAWKRLTAAGEKVIAIHDTPAPLRDGVPDVPSCVADTKSPDTSCAVSEAKAIVIDPQVAAVRATAGAQLITLTNEFCVDGKCPPVIGNVLVYIDGHHMSGLYSQTLAPALGRALLPAIARATN